MPEIWLAVGVVVGTYLLVGCVLMLILWWDADFARWTLKGVIIGVCLSPLATVEYALGQLRDKLVKQ